MSFPKKFLSWPLGWQDLGKVNTWIEISNYRTALVHTFCRTRLRIGRENNKIFRYCPRCKVKVLVLE